MFDQSAWDAICHNAEPNTYGHECGKPAVWRGTKQRLTFSAYVGQVESTVFQSTFCDRCKRVGYEARDFNQWERV